jgi:putative membrane protein
MMFVTTLLADTHWHHHWWFVIWPIVWLLVFFVLARFVFWRGRRGPWTPAGPDPRTILAERYARGEIDHQEYRERLGNLGR